MIFVQSRDDDHVLRACTTNNEQRPDNGNPTFPNVALAPQIWFRHTTFLTPKLSQTLNHATSGPQVSFAVATWQLGISLRISNFANTISRRSREGHPSRCVCLVRPHLASFRSLHVHPPPALSSFSSVLVILDLNLTINPRPVVTTFRNVSLLWTNNTTRLR